MEAVNVIFQTVTCLTSIPAMRAANRHKQTGSAHLRNKPHGTRARSKGFQLCITTSETAKDYTVEPNKRRSVWSVLQCFVTKRILRTESSQWFIRGGKFRKPVTAAAVGAASPCASRRVSPCDLRRYYGALAAEITHEKQHASTKFGKFGGVRSHPSGFRGGNHNNVAFNTKALSYPPKNALQRHSQNSQAHRSMDRKKWLSSRGMRFSEQRGETMKS